MRQSEWMRKLLVSRGLETPDGRPLYQYRLSDSEFTELSELLKITTQFGIANFPKMFFWGALFVMYASEWWRREYSGHWGWEDVFGSIGANFEELPVGARNDLVETGLRRWRREVRSSIGHRSFLGTIATEGGLPLKQLSQSGGWLRHLLQPVLRKHIEKGHSVSALIEAYSDLIPKSYGSALISEILEDIVNAIVALRNEHRLSEKDRPIMWLDEHQPKWRELFPLPLDDNAARSLLRDLIDTVAKAQTGLGSAFPFECDRVLINAEFANPELIAQIELPSFVSLKSLGLEQAEDLPSTLDMEVFEPGGKVWPWCRAVLTTFKNERAFKLSGQNFKVKGDDATWEFKVCLKFRGEPVAEIEVAGGELVDLKLPWLFKKVHEKWTLSGTASQNVRDLEAFFYSPDEFDVQVLDETSVLTACSPIFKGRIWRLQGSVSCECDEDRYRLSTGKEDTSSYFVLSGNKFPYSSIPQEVYIGAPRLYEKNVLTGNNQSRHATRVLTKLVGQPDGGWRPLNDSMQGVYHVRALDIENSILFSRTIGVLSREYSHTITPDRSDVCRGQIRIGGMSGMEIAVNQPGVCVRLDKNENDTSLDLLASPQPPRFIAVSFLGSQQRRGFTLNYPFPSRGAMLFDASEKLVSTTKPLNLQDLHGYRIKIFNDQAHLASRISLTISLIDNALPIVDQRDIYIKVPLKLRGEYIELAITDWLPMIKSLFGVAKSLDAEVGISLGINSTTLLAIKVRRYEHELTREKEEGNVNISSLDFRDVSLDDLDQSNILALNLNNPNMEPVPLKARFSQGVHVGSWDFVPQARNVGPWIIYPDPESRLRFRPLLWTVGLSTGENNHFVVDVKNLAESIAIVDENLRREAIALELMKMSREHEHGNWHYLEELWIRTSHLPLVVFDIWLVAIQVPAFLASLLIKDRLDILERLEDELPLIWELVSKAEWELALMAYRSRLDMHLGDDAELVDDLMAQVIEKITLRASSMLSMGKILNNTVRGVDAPELHLMKLPISTFLKPAMEEFYQELFRRQSEMDWPPMMRSELSRLFDALPEEYQSIVEPRNTYQQSVVYLPFVLAWNAIIGDEGGWGKTSSQIFKILQIKMFDEDWFNSAFQYLSGWLSQQQFAD